MDNTRKELYDKIKSGIKADFRVVVERVKACAETAATEKRIDESVSYIELDSNNNPFRKSKNSTGM